MPGSESYSSFKEIPKLIYSENSPRFILGNDPVEEHLEGCYLFMSGQEAVGRFAFYENPRLTLDGKKICTIGSYECIDDAATAKSILSYAIELAKKKEYDIIIGPMEGSTWNNYRFSTHNKHPNFFMEPYHHDYYPSQWTAFGFSPVAHYVSNKDEDLKFEAKTIENFESEIAKNRLTVRNLDMHKLETELIYLARFNNDAFKNNFLFSIISEEAFLNKYYPFRKYLDPKLIWIIEDEKAEIQALSFSIRDFMNQNENSLIIKTLARRKDAPMKGIGAYLIHKTYQTAKQEGYESIIHALMIQDNSSVSISEKYDGSAYKSYVLFKYEL